MRGPIKTELHHWWPRTLSEHWAAPDGMVSAIMPDGTVKPAPPGTFGAITNAHHIKMGGPWDSTFEPQFNQPDSEMSDFVDWLFTLEASFVASDRPMVERIAPQPLPDEKREQLARVTASLIARSPRIRNVIKRRTEYHRGEMGLADMRADKTLIALNQQNLYEDYRKTLERGGRWALLFSDDREFIAGDGFLHNFSATAGMHSSGRKLVLPILPTASIVYMSPMSYPSEPRLVTLRVDANEADTLNEVVQIYSAGMLFFRAQKPILSAAFRTGDHREFRYHRFDWLDRLFDDLSQFSLWGKGGTPVISGKRYFSRTGLLERFSQGGL